jgi:hypothetical protein
LLEAELGAVTQLAAHFEKIRRGDVESHLAGHARQRPQAIAKARCHSRRQCLAA